MEKNSVIIYSVTFLLFIVVTSCKGPRVIYSFESQAINDTLNNYFDDKEYKSPNAQKKWFVLMRYNPAYYEIIVNNYFYMKRENPIRKIAQSTNRYIELSNGIKVPVIFESDILSYEMRSSNVGGFNIGGYYLKIVKENGEYSIKETAILF